MFSQLRTSLPPQKLQTAFCDELQIAIYFLDLFFSDVCHAFYWEMQMYYPLQLLHISLINQCIVTTTTNGLALYVKKSLTSNVL